MILGYHYGTVEDIEIIWVLLALFGHIFSVLNFFDAFGDYKFLKAEGVSNGRMLVAKTNLYSEGIRAIIQFIFLAIGVIVLFLPSAPEAHGLVLAAGIMIRWGLILSSALLTVKTILLRRMRKILVEGGH